MPPRPAPGANPGPRPAPRSARPAAGGSRPAGGPAPAAAKVQLPRTGKPVSRGPYRVDVVKRTMAGAIDVAVGGLVGLALYFGLGLIGAALPLCAYLLLRDGLPIGALEGRSVGKKIIGLHVEMATTGSEQIDPGTSCKRNLPLAAGCLLGTVLALLVNGMLGLLVAVLPAVVELVLAATDANGARLGDRIAGTRVLD